MSDFKAHSSSVVREYIHSVLMIDDQAGMGETDTVKKPVVKLKAPSSPAASLGSKMFGGKAVEKDSEEVLATERPDPYQGLAADNHLFDAQKATSSFYEQGIVAGLYKPVIGEELTSEDFAATVKEPALKSDVVIVDWMLKKDSPNYSKELIKSIIKNDIDQGGRLRVIIVYTGEQYLKLKRDELHLFLDAVEGINVVKRDDYEIHSKNLVISFYNKPKVTSSDGRSIESDQLPRVSLEEFGKLVDGIVPSFAMKAAGTIRQNTGRIVSRFGENLDAAYLSHRALLPDPEDSEVFMLENFVSYMRNILAIGRVDSLTLGAESIARWIDKSQSSLNRTVTYDGSEYHLEIEDFIKIAQGGFQQNLYEVLSRKAVNMSLAYKDTSKEASLKAISIFDNEKCTAQESSIELSILSVFRRTYKDVANVSEIPYLTQGTLIYSKINDKFLLCVTPKCDTVRINKNKKFSFAILDEVVGKKFDMVIPMNSFVENNKIEVCQNKKEEIISLIIDDRILNGGKTTDHTLYDDLRKLERETYGKYVYLSTSSKFYALEHIVFECDEKKRVLGVKLDDDLIEFWDQECNDYIWIGDLHDLNTISRVGKLITNLNRTGTDELEWLRRQYQ